MFVFMSVCAHAFVSVHAGACVHCTCMCVCVCMHACLYVCMYEKDNIFSVYLISDCIVFVILDEDF